MAALEDILDLRRLVQQEGLNACLPALSQSDRRLAETLHEMLTEESPALGFAMSALCAMSLPSRRPAAGESVWSRADGHAGLTVEAMTITGEDGRRYRPGLPFGIWARRLLLILQDAAIARNAKRLIEIDPPAEILCAYKIPATGGKEGSITRLVDQMARICTSVWTITWTDDAGRRTLIPAERIAERVEWRGDGRWPTMLMLGGAFFESCRARPAAYRVTALRHLDTPLSLDLYLWLAQRMIRVRQRQVVPWASLQAQIGSNYRRTRDFRSAAVDALRAVLVAYPEANLEDREAGLHLLPSLLPVMRP